MKSMSVRLYSLRVDFPFRRIVTRKCRIRSAIRIRRTVRDSGFPTGGDIFREYRNRFSTVEKRRLFRQPFPRHCYHFVSDHRRCLTFFSAAVLTQADFRISNHFNFQSFEMASKSEYLMYRECEILNRLIHIFQSSISCRRMEP